MEVTVKSIFVAAVIFSSLSIYHVIDDIIDYCVLSA